MAKLRNIHMQQEWKRPIWKTTGILIAVLILRLWSNSPNRVEQWYSVGLYPLMARVQRLLTGWLPFSLGDLFYAGCVLYLLVLLVKGIRRLFRNGISWQGTGLLGLKLLRCLLSVYLVFQLLWGLNYNRKGIAWQLQMPAESYTTAELNSLTVELREKVNNSRRQLGDSIHYAGFDSLRQQSLRAYQLAAAKFSFLKYRQPSVKSSLFSEMLTYAGYTGYYNPFSGEAQVNTHVPDFYLPYVICHEMAHQLGYGDESEANFVSYLVTTASNEPFFHYSAYYDLFNYANGELYLRDSVAARNNYRALDTLVKQDMRAARLFFSRYRNRIEPVLKFVYGQYLKANNQPQGIDTYEAVTAWLMAYRKRNGAL